MPWDSDTLLWRLIHCFLSGSGIWLRSKTCFNGKHGRNTGMYCCARCGCNKLAKKHWAGARIVPTSGFDSITGNLVTCAKDESSPSRSRGGNTLVLNWCQPYDGGLIEYSSDDEIPHIVRMQRSILFHKHKALRWLQSLLNPEASQLCIAVSSKESRNRSSFMGTLVAWVNYHASIYQRGFD